MLGSYLHPETGEEVVISADSRAYHWINVAAGERLSFELNVEDFKLIPLDGSDGIEITFEMQEDIVTAAIRGEIRYERMIGIMEAKVREEAVHLILPEVERKAGGNIHAFICNVENSEDWRDFSVLAAIATNAYLNSGIPCVIVDDTSPADDDAIQNLLDRLQPNQVTIFRSEDEKLQGQIKGSESASVTERTCNTLSQMNEFVATTWAGEIKRAVVVSNAHYGNALLATSLATLMQSPLFVTEKAEDLLEIKGFGTYPLLVVGEDLDFPDAEVICIPNMAKAMSYLKEEKMNINYIALTNPLDRKTKMKLSLTAPIYAAAHGGLVLPLKDVELEKAASLDAPALTKVKEQLNELYQVLGSPRFLNLVGTTESVPACETTEDVNNSKQWAVTDYQYATVNFNLDDCPAEIAVGRCYTDSSTAGFLLATRSVNFPVLRAAGDWKDKIVDAGLWGWPGLRQIFWNAGFSLAEVQKDEMKPLHAKDFDNNKSIEAAAILHKDHSGWAGLGQCIRRDTNVMFAPCVFLSSGCHAAGIDEGCPSCASRVMARGGICFTGAARCPTAIATLWSVAFFNALVVKNQSLGEANQAAHNAFLAHHLRGMGLGKYTLVNRFTLGDPALRPYASAASDETLTARQVFPEAKTVVVTGPAAWSMVPVHPDQLKEWKYEGTLFNPVAPGCSPEAKWCGGGYDEFVPYYQLVVKVPPTTKGVVMKQLIYNKDSKDITVEAVDVSGVDPVCGEYECSQYIDKGKGNDWHYVTVTKIGDGEDTCYKWSNRAGKSWTLDFKTLDIDESCPYYDSGRHNVPQRNAQNIVTSMIFGNEAYNRVDVDVKNPEFAEAKKLWWPGEAQNLKDLSDGNKLLLLPLKMMEYDQKTGELQAFVKNCKFEVLTDSDCNLAELNKMPTVAERGGGRGIALAMQNRE